MSPGELLLQGRARPGNLSRQCCHEETPPLTLGPWCLGMSKAPCGVMVCLGLVSEGVALGIQQAEGAILGLFQEKGMQDPQGMTHMEKCWCHHGYHAFHGVDPAAAPATAARGSLPIALRADTFTAATKACLWADVVMFAVAKSASGIRPAMLGGDFNVCLESPDHPTTKKFVAVREQCGFLRVRHSLEQDRQHTHDGHKLDSFLMNVGVIPSAMSERQYLAPGRPAMAVGSYHGTVVPGIAVVRAAKERIACMAYSHAQGRLHAIHLDLRGVGKAAADVLQRACGDPAPKAWLFSYQDRTIMDTLPLQAVFDPLYSFHDDVSRVTRVRMPSRVDPQYPYAWAEMEASLS